MPLTTTTGEGAHQLWGQDIFAQNYLLLNKILAFYTVFAQKYFSPNFGGKCAPTLSPSPMPDQHPVMRNGKIVPTCSYDYVNVIDIGAQSTLGARHFCPKKYV